MPVIFPLKPKSVVTTWDLRDDLQKQKAVIDFANEPERFANLVATLKPDFGGLNPARLKKLAALTGRDFLLLDELLATLANPEEIDTLDTRRMLTALKGNISKGRRFTCQP